MSASRSARTLAELVKFRKAADLAQISLPNCPDFICKNMFCEFVTETCVCKVDKAISMLEHPSAVTEVDLSENGLSKIPPSLALLSNLKQLNLSKNNLKEVPAAVTAAIKEGKLHQLRSIDMRGNPIAKEYWTRLEESHPNIASTIQRDD